MTGEPTGTMRGAVRELGSGTSAGSGHVPGPAQDSAQDSAQDWRQAEGLTGRLKEVVLVLVILSIGTFLLSRELDRPFARGMHDWNGSWYSLVARNYERHDFEETSGAMCLNFEGEEPSRYYLNHPPLIGLMTWASFSLFGEGEWQARIVPVVFSLGALFFGYLFLRRLFDPVLAAVGTLAAVATPIWTYYGCMPDPQGGGVLFGMMGALWSFTVFAEERRRSMRWVALFFALVAACFDWPGFILAACLGAWAFCRGDRRTAAWCWGGATVLGFALIGWSIHLDPGALDKALSTRGGLFEGSLSTTAASILENHRTGFYWPMSLIGLVAALCLARDSYRSRRGTIHGSTRSTALLLIPLVVGGIHTVAFPQGAGHHEYWQIYLAPGLAFPLAWLLSKLAINRRALAYALGGILVTGSTILAYQDVTDRLEFRKDRRAEQKNLGTVLRKWTEPNKMIVTSLLGSMSLAYYADRQFLWNFEEFGDVGKLFQFRDQEIGAFLLRTNHPALVEHSGVFSQLESRDLLGRYRLFYIPTLK